MHHGMMSLRIVRARLGVWMLSGASIFEGAALQAFRGHEPDSSSFSSLFTSAELFGDGDGKKIKPPAMNYIYYIYMYICIYF